jgi:S-DNA-T family DNA segregation ATPase FtsK/SpoIIIE
MALEELPHCGSVIRSIESERMTAWITKLSEEHRRRQNDLASGGFSTFDEMRASQGAQPTPYIVVLIDRWENVLQEFPPESGSTVSGDLARLIREGTGPGIRFVLSGDRALLSDRVASHLTHRFALSLSDVNDYRQIDIQPRDVPSDMAPGRALLAGSGVEVQFGIWLQAFEIPNREALRALAGILNVTPASGQLRVDVLPNKISLEQSATLPPAAASPSGAPLAVGGDTLSLFSITVSQLQPGFLIAGPRKSGKTTAAVNLVRGAIDEGLTVHIWAGLSKPLYQTQFGDEISYLEESALVQVAEDLNLREGRHFVVIDDSDRFFRSALDGHLVEIVNSGADVRVVVTGAIEDFVNDLRGVSSLCKRSQNGLILQPQSSIDGQVFGQRIDKSLLGGNQGRAQLFLLGQQYRVQVISS